MMIITIESYGEITQYLPENYQLEIHSQTGGGFHYTGIGNRGGSVSSSSAGTGKMCLCHRRGYSAAPIYIKRRYPIGAVVACSWRLR